MPIFQCVYTSKMVSIAYTTFYGTSIWLKGGGGAMVLLWKQIWWKIISVRICFGRNKNNVAKRKIPLHRKAKRKKQFDSEKTHSSSPSLQVKWMFHYNKKLFVSKAGVQTNLKIYFDTLHSKELSECLVRNIDII